MTTPRREFLSWLGASGAFAAAGLPAFPPGTPVALPLPVSDKWDMTWCDRITGKVRAVFDSPELAGGAAMWRAQLWREQHAEVYGVPQSEASAVIVFRHTAIPLVMNDAYWTRFEIGKKEEVRDSNGKKWAKINPIGSLAPGTPEASASYTLPGFIKSGGVALACNLAFYDVVGRYQKEDKLSEADAHKRAVENLIPGVILQPSGFFAVLRAQQAGCNYLMAS